MSEIAPLREISAPPRRVGRMGWTVVGSVSVHALIFGVLLLPSLPLAEPPGPPAINVDIVPSKEAASLELSSQRSSSAPGSSQPPSEASSSEPERSPSALASEAPSSQASGVPSSAAASEVSSGASASASAAASSAPPPSASAASQEAPKPVPAPRGGKLIVPVGPAESSSEVTSSAASEGSSAAPDASSAAASSSAFDALASLLTAAGEGSDGASSAASAAAEPAAKTPPMPVIGGGRLHAAHRFYLKEMLASPILSQAREALKQMPPERRLAQTCNIEATGQASAGGSPADAIIANAFAAPAISGNTYSVSGGAFRTVGQWYRIAFQCTLSSDLSRVTSFAFHIGDEVTAEMTARLGARQ